MKIEKLKEIEKILEDLEDFKNDNTEQLKEKKKKIDGIIKFLVGTKNYYQKQETKNLGEIRKLIKIAKKINKEIIESLNNKEQKLYVNKKDEAVINKFSDLEELLNIKNIICSGMSKEEKEQSLLYILEKYKNKLTILLDDLNFFKELRKDLIILKNYEEINNCDNSIFNIKIEVNECKLIIQSCKTYLAQIHGKDVKIDYPKAKKENVKKEKINEYYYKIIYDLLDDDKNYFFLKEIITTDTRFLKARKWSDKSKKNEHIIFKILDEYIKNTKLELVNQKLVHSNPKFFYSLLEIFFQNEMNLKEEEKVKVKDTIADFKVYLNEKGYENSSDLINSIDKLFNKKQLKGNKNNINLYRQYFKQQMNDFVKNSDRTNLTKEYLQPLSTKIYKFINEYAIENNEQPTTRVISENLEIPIHDIRNSLFLGDTIVIGKSKYAYSMGYDKDFNIYFRVNVLDTTFIDENSIWAQDMEYNMLNNLSKFNKDMKYKEDEIYPVITYQFKITKNGVVESFKIYSSTIKIDKKVDYDEFLHYRDDDSLKNIIACIKKLIGDYNIDYSYLEMNDIEDYIDYILNIEVIKYLEQNDLMSLYYIEVGLSEEEKINIHNKICYDLSKIPKKEAHEILRILLNLKITRYYEEFKNDESKVELDSRTYIGYLNLKILRLFRNGLWTEEMKEKYANIFENIKNNVNEEKFSIYYEKEKKLKRAKIEAIKEEKRSDN